MTQDSSIAGTDITLRSPEQIIRERDLLEEAHDEARQEDVYRDRIARDAKSNIEYKQLRVEIVAEIRKIPERLRQSNYKDGELVDVLSEVIAHQRRRFLRKEGYIVVQTKQKALWRLHNPHGKLWISADGTLFARKYIKDDQDANRSLLDEHGNSIAANITVLFDALFPVEKPQRTSVDDYRQMLKELRNLGAQAP